MGAHISLLELVHDTTSDTIDDVDGQGGWVLGAFGDYREHAVVNELVEEVAFLAEDGWQVADSFSGLRW